MRWFRHKRSKAVHPFHVVMGGQYNEDVNFTRNETVFQVNVVVANELLRDMPPASAAERISEQAATLALHSVQSFYRCRGA